MPFAAENLPVPLPLVLAGIVVVIAACVLWYLRRRAAASMNSRLRRVVDDMLAGVLVPGAEGGLLHVEYALLTRPGIVLVEVRDIAGHVFGSETMEEWTVLGDRRFTFANPLPALYDRVAAVRRLVPEVPVRACIAFTDKAQFSKGFPPNVVMLEALFGELAAARDVADAPPQEQMQAAWARLRHEAVAARQGRRR